MTTLKYILFTLLLLAAFPMKAQREVTPVESDEKKPQTPVLHYYDKHGDPLDEPVLFLATLDTVAPAAQRAKPVYPAIYAIDFGVNFFDAITAIAGQKYGGADISASLSMWNWLFPTIEAGLAGASSTPKGNNYTYKSGPSPYFKIGADYNFLYKSNPQYRLLLGLRFGISPFSYQLSDVTVNSGYWDQTQTLTLPSQTSTALYGELLIGLKVNIWKQLSLGWTVRLHHLFHSSASEIGEPWYIPGMGTRNSKIGATFSIIYTLPLHRAEPAKEPEE